MPQTVQLPCINAMAVGFQPLLHHPGECQIHVVAAQQNVVADGYAFQYQLPILLRYGDQAEVRCSSSDIADQDQVADLDTFAPAITLALEPGVKGSLGLFKQGDVFQS